MLGHSDFFFKFTLDFYICKSQSRSISLFCHVLFGLCVVIIIIFVAVVVWVVHFYCCCFYCCCCYSRDSATLLNIVLSLSVCGGVVRCCCCCCYTTHVMQRDSDTYCYCTLFSNPLYVPQVG